MSSEIERPAYVLQGPKYYTSACRVRTEAIERVGQYRTSMTISSTRFRSSSSRLTAPGGRCRSIFSLAARERFSMRNRTSSGLCTSIFRIRSCSMVEGFTVVQTDVRRVLVGCMGCVLAVAYIRFSISKSHSVGLQNMKFTQLLRS